MRIYTENGRFVFLSPLWGLRGNVRTMFIGKRVVDFPLVFFHMSGRRR